MLTALYLLTSSTGLWACAMAECVHALFIAWAVSLCSQQQVYVQLGKNTLSDLANAGEILLAKKMNFLPS